MTGEPSLFCDIQDYVENNYGIQYLVLVIDFSFLGWYIDIGAMKHKMINYKR